MKKICFIIGLLGFIRPAFAVWDTSTPSGTEAKSLGDDRIREFKTDMQTSLRYLGTSDFPGTDTSNPRYIPKISTITTSSRPSGNAAPTGRLIINISSHTMEIVDASGSWSAVDVVPSSSIYPVDLSTSVAGDGLIGGGGTNTELQVQVDTNTLQISTDTVRVRDGGINTVQLATGAVNTWNIASGAVTPGKFSSFLQFEAWARSADTRTDVTGDGSTYVMRFSSEIFDGGNQFNVSSWTVPSTGFYKINICARINGAVSASSEYCRFTASAPDVVTFWDTLPTFDSAMVADSQDSCHEASGYLTGGHRFYFQLACSGGTKTVDVIGGDSGMQTMISVYKVP